MPAPATPPARVRRRGRVIALDHASGLPLGIDPDETFDEHTIVLERHDALLLYTDGITEARGAGGEMFGIDRLDQAFMSSRISAAATVQQISDAAKAFSGRTGMYDDCTLLLAVTE